MLAGKELNLAQQYALIGVLSVPLFLLAGAGKHFAKDMYVIKFKSREKMRGKHSEEERKGKRERERESERKRPKSNGDEEAEREREKHCSFKKLNIEF